MKQLRYAITLLLLLINISVYAQDNTLPEVNVVSTTYKYLNVIDNKENAQPVRMLERTAATFDIKKSEFYDSDNDGYYVSFNIPEGKILATYDKDGKLLRTQEKFKNTKLPTIVAKKIAQLFPEWKIAKDVFLVKYFRQKDNPEKSYTVTLAQGKTSVKLLFSENGFLLN